MSFMLRQFAQQSVGGPVSAAVQRANALIISHVTQQAFVRGVDDAFLFAAAVTCIGVFPVFLLRTHKAKRKSSEHQPPAVE
jgi:hypothetical protein